MDKQQLKDLKSIKHGLGIILSIAKSFFLAVTQVAFGIASLFLLNLLIAYFMKDEIPFTISKLELLCFLNCIENIMVFVGVFFLLYWYYEIKEVLK